MALDGSDIDTSPEAAREAFCTTVGDEMLCVHSMSAVNKGFPPGTFSALNPAAYGEELKAGIYEMVDTLFGSARVAMEEAYGPAEATRLAQQFDSLVRSKDTDIALNSDVSGPDIPTRSA